MSGSKAPDTIIIEERQNRRKDIMKIGFIGLGNMPAAKIGRLWKFKVSEVDAWMKSGVAADK